VPVEVGAAAEQLRAQGVVATAVADVPLAAGHDLERAVALLEELDRVGDRARLAVELAGLLQQLDDAGLRLLGRLAGQLGVRLPACVAGDGGRRLAAQPAVALQHVAHGQVELAPPGDVGGVAEGADHRDAAALVGLGERVACTGTSTSNSGERTVVPNSGE
jgi:hypothetical protein